MFDPVITLLCLAHVCKLISQIKTFDPFGSSYLDQVNEFLPEIKVKWLKTKKSVHPP
jgi:hypothetical protein